MINQETPIFFTYELAAGFPEGFEHLLFLVHMLKLKNERAVSPRIEDDEVAPPIAALQFGNHSVAHSREKAVKDQVIAVFMVLMIEGKRGLKNLADGSLGVFFFSGPKR